MPFRIAMYTHSLNPRGGVVHALSLAEALQEAGHQVTLFVPALPGQRLFRQSTVSACLVPARPVAGGLSSLVRQRVEELSRCVVEQRSDFDLHHAHDAMTGYALALLRRRAEIPLLVRTVHHLDEFDEPFLNDAQRTSIEGADALLCVSRSWADELQSRFGRTATVVGNGVDPRRFSEQPDPTDRARCEAILGPMSGPMFLSVGGVEHRKNTLRSLEAFLEARPALPADSRLMIVGGATLLDHSDYRRQFDAKLRSSDGARSVIVTGPIADSVIPAMYRCATALVFPSLVEGFGLAVLEAMASGLPVIASRRAPFTEYLSEVDALLVNPSDPSEIASAMKAVLDRDVRRRLIENGRMVASRCTWSACARACAAEYERLLKPSGGSDAGDVVCCSLAG